MPDDILICCPSCKWEPFEDSMWECNCGTVWNTFSTAGRCPGCGKVWKDTQCPECSAWNPHLDWYNGLDKIVRKLTEAVEEIRLTEA
jgi:hypothetical protein